MKAQIQHLAKEFHQEITEIRHHLHSNPELSFVEFETSKYIQSQLDKMGVEYEAGIVKTGIIALIKGRNPDKKVIALRADIDALPIVEQNTGKSYCSKNEGVMHACGHDVHTSCALGAIKILNEIKDSFEGTVKVLFQPGEEKLPGGASLMIKEGALKNPTPTEIYGQHVFPDLEAGKVGFRGGMYMASADEIYVTVKGKGGHAALPQHNIDPILIASHIIVALQQIVSRHAVPYVPTVLSFGKIEGYGATNVIPNEVKIQGTFRTMDEKWRAEAHQKMIKMAEGIAESMGGSCEFTVANGYPFLTNDENVTAKAKQRAIEFLGAENVIDLELRMSGEDFAYYSQEMPACFYRLGTRNEAQGITSQVHTPTFDIDENALETGMGLMAYLAFGELSY
jgi:amidohydrolase